MDVFLEADKVTPERLDSDDIDQEQIHICCTHNFKAMFYFEF